MSNRETLSRIIQNGAENIQACIAKITLDDLSKGAEGVDSVLGLLRATESRLEDEWASLPPSLLEAYEEVKDSVFFDMKEAGEEAVVAVASMIDDGWADPGFEDDVQREFEDQIIPALESAVTKFEEDALEAISATN